MIAPSGASAGAAAEDAPLVYIASPLTRAITDQDRQQILFGVDKIVATVHEKRSESGELLRTHAPAVLSAPWGGEHEPQQIFRQNSMLVLAEADALISLALDGGSDGTGQEVAFANLRGIPVLRLSPDGDDISRQVRGNPMVEARPYNSPDELGIIIRQFLHEHSAAIFDGPRTRRAKSILYLPVQQDLESVWRQQPAGGRGAVAVATRLPPTQLDHVLSHPLLVSTLAHAQLIEVGDALGVDVSMYFAAEREPLSIAQLEALIIAKDEFGWTDEDAEWLRDVARREILGAGTKRLLLNSPADWLQLKETISR